MELKPTIDLGQILITTIISIIGFFIKLELGRISSRLDGHDSKIFTLMSQVSELIGAFNARKRERINKQDFGE